MEEFVRLAAAGDGGVCRQINSTIKQLYGPRNTLTEEQLLAAIQYIKQNYELSGASAPRE